jgi:hypothetical protein
MVAGLYPAAWVAFFPVLAMRREWIFRILTGVLLFSSACSLAYWVEDTWCYMRNDDVCHLEGKGPYRWELWRAQLLQAMSRVKQQTFFMAKGGFPYSDCLMLSSFSGNRAYIAWGGQLRSGDTLGESIEREVAVANFYDGKMDDPLTYLRTRDIGGAVIWPGDDVSDAILKKLKKQLSPTYEYLDFRGDADRNIGLFIYRPNMDTRRVSVTGEAGLNGAAGQAAVPPSTPAK